MHDRADRRSGHDLDRLLTADHLPPVTDIRTVCVYCGSSAGEDRAFEDGARALGRHLAQADIRLIYGGGGRGLMGTLARSVVASGGKVTGVIPSFLSEFELAFDGADEMIVTADMHERKRLMFERADAFVALPGGIGTLEELVEQMTWAQLGRHRKPIVLVNVAGFWDPLLALIDHMKSTGFIRPSLQPKLLVADTVDRVVPMLKSVTASPFPPAPPGA